MRQGNRRQALVIAGIVGLLLVTFLLRRQAASPSSRRSSTVTNAAGPSVTRLRVTPVPGGSLRISGTVRNEHGPVAGVRVSASRVDPEETLSERPCPAPDLLTTDAGAAGFATTPWLMDCWPQAQAQVMEQVNAREGEAPVLAETTTGADGTFVLDGLPEGAITLWALGEAGAVKQHDILAGTRDVVLSLDDGLVFEGSVKVEGSPAPLTEVTLTLFSHHHTRFFDVRADARGHFRLGPLPRTRYAALFALEGEGVLLIQEVRPGDLEDLTLHRPSRFSGQVVSEQGAPAAGVQVWLAPLISQHDHLLQAATTNSQGRFAFTTALPSEMEGSAWSSAMEVSAWSSAQDAFASIESPPGEGLLLQLRPGVFLQGTVRDDTGKSVAGAKITAQSFQPVALGERGQAVTRADGSYRLGPLAPANYDLLVQAEHHLDDGPVDQEVAEDTQPRDFTLQRASSVEGQLVDEAGQPLAGLEVTLHTGELPLTGTGSTDDVAVSDETGRFVLDSQTVGPGWIEIDGDRFIPERFAVRIPSRGVRRMLRRGSTVRGTVVSVAGAPMPGIDIALWKRDVQDDAERSGVTDEQGRFTLQGVEPGRYVVEASVRAKAHTRRVSQPVEVVDGETATVSLRMEGTRMLAGLTVDEAGRPLPGVRIRMWVPEEDLPLYRESPDAPWSGLESLRSDDKGRFVLNHLDATRYVLTANHDDYDFEPASSQGGLPGKKYTLRVGSDVREVRLVLHRRPHVRGRVVGPGGAPVTAFTVNFDEQRSPSGDFDVDLSAATGQHTLVIRAKGLATLEQTFTVEGGADVDLGTLTLSGGRTVRGVLRDAQTGLPFTGEVRDGLGHKVRRTDTIAYRLRSEGPGDPVLAYPRLRAALAPDGTWLLEHLPSTPLTLQLEVPGYLPLRQTLDAGAREFTGLLERGARVEVNIRDAQGRPIPAIVGITMPDGDMQQRMASTGTLVMSGLSPGLHAFTATSLDEGDKRLSENNVQPKSLRVPASGQVVLTLEALERGATLTLRLADDVLKAHLIPGSEPWPEDVMASRRLGARGHPQERLARLPVTLRFDRAPAGHYTLFAFDRAGERIHREELELPAEGTVSVELRPAWRPLAP
ncbi:carboxypeptidase-like regulatory domain-containing protein [Corallococcus sp. bb12-1]|uniref:carboxypeptidase-like regulatory domain-containing protein n=1 Tax=Corallococcus sp. bb12-1 TaxID=2996784 RepID=UPI0022716741|nr:carboxypeptidase-like regulatory domain-containing protein [Corallococcus sp. bb12-1]MCY1043824.1 carboxypeptidase-like regulatory domain-containing protein [Corallococcus sp. bb12-1]